MSAMTESPCINVCKMDEATGLCQGCYRSLAEIAAWANAGDRTKALILAAVAQRRARLTTSAEPVRSRPG